MISKFLRVCSFVYLVWDGDLLPCKAVSVIERRKKREADCIKGL